MKAKGSRQSDGVVVVRVAAHAALPAAQRVWRVSTAARGRAPSEQRIERVQNKLQDTDAMVVLGWLDEQVVAMALAEPRREDDGAGPVLPGWGHVSMVFVSPDRWGQGTGTVLLQGLHRLIASTRGWTSTGLWTRTGNLRAQRLYVGNGYLTTGQADTLPTGETIMEMERANACTLRRRAAADDEDMSAPIDTGSLHRP